MMRSVFILLFTLLSTAAICQTEEELYYAWLDSIKNDKYTMANVVHLDEVIITDSTKRAYLQNPKNKTNLRNTDQMLHAMAGIHMVRRGNFAAEPMLRGLTSERYVTTIDGMRVFSACTDKMDPISSYIEPINLRSLETTFGSQGNMAGSSTGGSVSFGLKKPVFNRDSPFRSSANLGYSSVSNGFDQALDLNHSFSKVAVRLSGVHRKAQNYADGNGDEVRYSQYEKFNYASSISYRASDEHLITFDYLGDDAIDVGYPALPMDVSSARARMFGLTLLMPRLGLLQDPELKVYHNYIKHVMDDTKRDSVAMHMDMPGETKTSGLFVRGTVFEKQKQWLRLKTDFFHTYAHAEMTMYPNETGQLPMFMLTWPDVKRAVAGLEMQHGYKFKKDLQLTTSLRVENASTFVSNDFGERQLTVFDKTGNVRRELLNNLSFVLSHEKDSRVSSLTLAYGERLPSISEQFGFYLFNRQDGFDYLGDPDIAKEKNLQVEASQSWSSSLMNVKATAFTYLFSDYIIGVYDPSLSAMTIGARGVKWYQNISSARMHGGELTYQVNFADTWSLFGDAKYVFGADHEGNPLPQQPPLKTSWSLIKNLKGWILQPELEYAARQHRISEVFFEQQTDAFMLLNFRWSKEFSSGGVTYKLGGGLENITNVAYREHFDIASILRPGRNLYLQFTLTL
ncbi:MAG: TonB-dependent receptor [Ekhidna sp.]